jgi:hypothetical protein
MAPPLPYVVLSGFCWIGVYVLIIMHGLKEKSYGMPLVPMSANIAWETVFTSVYPIGSGSPARVIIHLWLVLDLCVFVTFLSYGYRYFERDYHLTRLQFYTAGVFTLVCAFAFFIAAPPILLGLSFFKGSMFEVASFLAYAPNSILISTLFVNMAWRRKNAEGQSFYIGLLRWIGTLLVAVWYLVEHDYFFVWFMIGVIEVFDMTYLALIYQRLTVAGRNPLRIL